MKKRVCCFGGAFDPPHLGHLQVVRHIMASDVCHTMMVLPAGSPPRKKARLPINYRLELCQTLFSLIPGVMVSALDAALSKPSYTANLLQNIIQIYPDWQFYWVIGTDNALQLPVWHNWPWLRENIHFIVVSRPGAALDDIARLPYAGLLTLLPMPEVDISSTMVRQRLANGEKLDDLVPAAIIPRLQELAGFYKEDGKA